MAKTAVFVELVTLEGRFDECYRLFLDHAAASRRESGCLRFDVAIPDGSANRMMLYELYEDRHAFDAHSTTERIERHRERAHPLLAEKRLTVCDVIDA